MVSVIEDNEWPLSLMRTHRVSAETKPQVLTCAAQQLPDGPRLSVTIRESENNGLYGHAFVPGLPLVRRKLAARWPFPVALLSATSYLYWLCTSTLGLILFKIKSVYSEANINVCFQDFKILLGSHPKGFLKPITKQNKVMICFRTHETTVGNKTEKYGRTDTKIHWSAGLL